MNIQLIQDDGTKKIVERVKAKMASKDNEIAALRAENARLEQLWKRDSEHLIEVGAKNARLREVLQLGTYLLTIPAIRDIMKSQLENEELSPIADFENSARAALESTNA